VVSFEQSKMRSKRKLKIKVIALLITTIFVADAYLGQEKFEREGRISKSERPDFAIQFGTIFTENQCIKWYLEEGLERHSIEAKYKRNGQRYSVEFDTLGVLEDVEIQVKAKSIPVKTREIIKNRLLADGESYKVDKIQIQYTGEKEALKEVSKSGNCSADCVIRYELIVRIKKDKQLSSFEYLFSEDGAFLQRSEIIIQTSSNLEY